MSSSGVVSRSFRDTAAAFTNCGLFPTTVAIDTVSLPGQALFSRPCGGCSGGPGTGSPIWLGTSLTRSTGTSGRGLRPDRLKLFFDPRTQGLGGLTRDVSRGGRELAILDRCNGLNLARGRREEGLR